MSDKTQSQHALRDFTKAWERFRNFVHVVLPGMAGNTDAFTQVAKGKRNY